MTFIYVDQDAIAVDPRGSDALDEGALRSLGFLKEAGHDVVLVETPAMLRVVPVGEWATIALEDVPLRPVAPAWYLTSKVDRCRGRSGFLRTVLIGTASGPAAIHRCDTLARDIPAAVLEILAAEAMRP